MTFLFCFIHGIAGVQTPPVPPAPAPAPDVQQTPAQILQEQEYQSNYAASGDFNFTQVDSGVLKQLHKDTIRHVNAFATPAERTKAFNAYLNSIIQTKLDQEQAEEVWAEPNQKKKFEKMKLHYGRNLALEKKEREDEEAAAAAAVTNVSPKKKTPSKQQVDRKKEHFKSNSKKAKAPKVDSAANRNNLISKKRRETVVKNAESFSDDEKEVDDVDDVDAFMADQILKYEQACSDSDDDIASGLKSDDDDDIIEEPPTTAGRRSSTGGRPINVMMSDAGAVIEMLDDSVQTLILSHDGRSEQLAALNHYLNSVLQQLPLLTQVQITKGSTELVKVGLLKASSAHLDEVNFNREDTGRAVRSRRSKKYS